MSFKASNSALLKRVSRSKTFVATHTRKDHSECHWKNIYGILCKEKLQWSELCFCGHKRSSHTSNENNEHSCRLYNCNCEEYKYIPKTKLEVIANENNDVFVMLRRPSKKSSAINLNKKKK